MNKDYVMIGCPIRDRGYIIAMYFEYLFNLNYPKNKIHLRFLVNNCSNGDDTLEQLNYLKEKYGKQYYKFEIIEKQYKKDDGFDYPRDGRVERRFKGIYEILSKARNDWKSNLDKNIKWIFSVDSDILLHPETLNQLLETANRYKEENVQSVSALICNYGYGSVNWNVGHNNCLRVKEKIEKGYNIIRCKKISINKDVYVDITGACYIFSKEISEKFNYKPDESGEDTQFCLQIKEAGYKMMCNTRVHPRHMMQISWLPIMHERQYLGYLNKPFEPFEYCLQNIDTKQWYRSEQ